MSRLKTAEHMACSIAACDRTPYRRGWCKSHYTRWQEHGDPLAGNPIRERYSTPEESFSRRLVANGECIEWRGAETSAGYGNLFVSGKHTPAHRYSWERANGPIPEGAQVDHICGNKRCVHLPHLRLASNAENSRNHHGPRDRSKTGVRNVTWTKGAYQVVVGYNYRRVYGGRYANIEDAKRRAEQMRTALFGEFAGRG